ncbi:MAG: DUF4405 domain-containing protein [Thiolinea sp.]
MAGAFLFVSSIVEQRSAIKTLFKNNRNYISMFTLRNWATPITIGSFIISAITGVLIFFHINIGLVKPAHEWLSWFMILGVAMHLVINWRALKTTCANPFRSH